MMNLVLQRLETLQAELARLDPTSEIDATAQVAAMVVALRDVAAEARTVRERSSRRVEAFQVRAAAG